MRRFPCLRLAYEAAAAGGTAPAILNAANEVAVQAFLAGQVGFNHIASIIEHTLATVIINEESELELILEDDAHAREAAGKYIARLTGAGIKNPGHRSAH